MAWALLMSFSFPDENLVVKKMNLFAVWAFPWNGWTVLLILSSSDGFHSIRWHRNILLQQSAIHEVHVCIRALLCAAWCLTVAVARTFAAVMYNPFARFLNVLYWLPWQKMAESCTIQVAWRTPQEKLDALEEKLNTWLSTEENRWFQPSTSVVLQNISYQRYLECTIGISHNSYVYFSYRSEARKLIKFF